MQTFHGHPKIFRFFHFAFFHFSQKVAALGSSSQQTHTGASGSLDLHLFDQKVHKMAAGIFLIVFGDFRKKKFPLEHLIRNY